MREALNNDEYRTLEPDVKTAARTTAREWDGVIEADDAEQEIWVRLLESPGSVTTLTEMDQPGRLTAITAMGRQIASQYRDDYAYFSGNYSYGTEEVRKMLDRGALDSEETAGDFGADMPPIWELPLNIIGKLERTDTETATERVDLVLGVRALRDAQSPYFAEIVNRFVWDIRPADQAGRKRLQRAVDALTNEMNRVNTRRKFEYEGPGTRKVITNAEAQKLTRNEYTR